MLKRFDEVLAGLAGARVEVRSAPNEGLRVTILFSRADAAPDA